MGTQVFHRHGTTAVVPRWIIVALLSGAASVLVFHQGALALLNAAELTDRAAYSMQGAPPFGVPQVWSLAFWGAVWGVLLAFLLRPLGGAPLVVAATVFGALLPTLVAWFLVAPLKGQPMAAGFVLTAMAVSVFLNAAWGLGTGLGLALFGRQRARARR